MTTTTATTEDIKRVFAAQRDHQWTQRRTTAAQRIAQLERLRSAIENHADALRDGLYEWS